MQVGAYTLLYSHFCWYYGIQLKQGTLPETTANSGTPWSLSRYCGRTIKRQWGFSYILTKKGISRASADVGLIMTAYNLRRIINIVGINELKKYLKSALFFIFEKMPLQQLFSGKISPNIFKHKTTIKLLNVSLNQLYLNQKLTVQYGF